MSDKIFYTMGEVAEMFDVNASLIRYWGTQFSCLKPQRNKKGNRLFSKSDIETLKLIYHYVKERGMTLEGANMAMKRRGKSVQRDVSILERLQNIRAMLVEVRESLGESAEYEAPIEAVSDLIADVEKEAKAHVVEVVTTPEEVAASELVDEAKTEEEAAPEPRRRGRPRKVVEGDTTETTAPRRRTKKKEENQELFPFYEQSLF